MTHPLLHLRIFLSSPGDVADERSLALQVIDQLPYDPLLRGKVTFEVVAWDKPGAGTPMLATMTPQAAIDAGLPKPSECDIVVVIFWARMGTPLDYKGQSYLSGTYYEYEEAMQAARRFGRPEVLIYRRMEKILLDPDDGGFEAKHEQYQRVKEFFAAFVNKKTGAILQGYNQYAKPEDFRREFEMHLKVLVNRLLEAPPAPVAAPEPAKPIELWPGSPFPGLRAFTPADAPIFFGRGRETDTLVQRVKENRFVAVVGASGSGKSSLVGAGLLPRLKGNAIEGSKDWLLPEYEPGRGWIGLCFTPGELGDNPFVALAARLAPVGETPRELAERLVQTPGNAIAVIEQVLADRPEWAEALLFVDQFEELFTVVAPQYRPPFVELLVAASQSARLRTVVTMRSDFYHRCVDVPVLAGLLEGGSYPLSVPGQIALYEMIARPAERAGLVFEAGLPEQILDDTGSEPGALALLAYALDELYHAQTAGKLTTAAYEALGGVQGAIGRRAENIFAKLDGEVQAALPRVFRELVEVDEQGAATRRRAALAQITADVAQTQLIQAFTTARLLITSGTDTESTVEVAHEALFRSWTMLVEWIQQMRDDLRLLRQFERDARDWERRGKPLEGRPRNEQLQPLLTAATHLQVKLSDPVLIEYADLDTKRLLVELEEIATSHQRRSFIGERLWFLGDPRSGVGVKGVQVGGREVVVPDIEWCYVEAMPDSQGRLPRIQGVWRSHEIKPFWIGRYAVTAHQFQAFVDDDEGYNNLVWWQDAPANVKRHKLYTGGQLSNEPVVRISWYQAMGFSRWLTAKYGELGLFGQFQSQSKVLTGQPLEIRLPTEWEWQWAAQGGAEAREYPWGKWEEGRANSFEAGLGQLIGVGMYPAGAADCGALDMAGNVWEWCLNNYDRSGKKSLRGGSFALTRDYGRCASRFPLTPHGVDVNVGLRVVCGASPSF